MRALTKEQGMPSTFRTIVAAVAMCVALLPAAEARKIKQIPPPPAPPAPPERVTAVEGITEYRLANGLQVLLFPDQSKPTVTVNITYLVGSPPRELRRDRHGAPARAPDVQGHAQAPERRPGVQPARRALQRHHLARPHQLLRDSSRPSDDNLDVGDRAGGRPHGNSLHRAGRTSTAR